MLAGCSNLLSPRHRLRSEASTQFQACHFQLPSMNTQRLDLPCSFPRKDSTRPQPIRPVGLSIDKPIETKAIRLPPSSTTTQTAFIEGKRGEVRGEFWGKGKSLKRFSEDDESSCLKRVKRKRLSSTNDPIDEDCLTLGQLGSGDFWFQPQDRVSLAPSEVISPPFPLSNNPWLESIVTEITDLGEKETETGHATHARVKEASDSSSTSSDSRKLTVQLTDNPPRLEAGNGSKSTPPHEGGSEAAPVIEQQHEEEEEQNGFELISLLVACVEAIISKNIQVINHLLAKLGERAFPRGATPISRLTAYYTEAFALRVAKLWPHIFHINIPRELDRAEDDNGTSLRLLNEVSPILKFTHFTANEILLRAFEGKDRIHIIDFDVKQGLQWPSFFQSLASRRNPPSHVRITGIGTSKQDLNETKDRLSGFAEALNLPFEFHPVVDRLEDVRLWMLHVKERESVAVNCVFQFHKMLYDGNGIALRNLLGVVQSTNPVVIVMAEQEAYHNDPRLEVRLVNSLKYYSAIFDSIDSSLPLESPTRIKIQEMFSREIRNIIACEGSDRFERHETFEKWRELLEGNGFRCMGISEREMLQSQMLLRMYSCENYRVEKKGRENDSALTLIWEDQPLYTISAWTSLDASAESSSAFSRPI